jgi:hypothetical protein
MQVLGYRASQAFLSHPDIRAWAGTVALNPARIPPDSPPSPELAAALQRVHAYEQAGMTRMAQLAGIAWPPHSLGSQTVMEQRRPTQDHT